MLLQVGDQITDESGTWQVIVRPYSSAGGKTTQVRVQRVDQPGVTETRIWGSYEKVTVVPRATTKEGGFADSHAVPAHLDRNGQRRG